MAALENPPIRHKRCSVGVADWCTLGRSPRPLPLVPVCHRRFQQWVRSSTRIMTALAREQ
jgi:hypothetical protein